MKVADLQTAIRPTGLTAQQFREQVVAAFGDLQIAMNQKLTVDEVLINPTAMSLPLVAIMRSRVRHPDLAENAVLSVFINLRKRGIL